MLRLFGGNNACHGMNGCGLTAGKVGESALTHLCCLPYLPTLASVECRVKAESIGMTDVECKGTLSPLTVIVLRAI